MTTQPDYATFAKTYNAGAAQVVWTSVIADLETPVSAMLKLADGRANSFLLESVSGGSIRGRYSFIGLKPDLIWRCRGKEVEINRNARANADRFDPAGEDPLGSRRALIAEAAIDLPEGLPPMAAGLFGYMSYDMVRLMEILPDENPDVMGLPDGIFLRPTIICVFDTIEDVMTIVTPVRPRDGIDASAAFAQAEERLYDVLTDLDRPHPRSNDVALTDHDMPEPVSNMSRTAFHEMVERGKDYIQAGDVFQVVLSQRFEVPFKLPPFSLYRSLRRLNPSPFLFYLDFGDFSVVGSSPEILVRLRDDTVTIRPVAGTRPRGKAAAEDKA